MRKLLLLLITVVALAAAGAVASKARPAAAASQTVTISATGYKPTAVSITAGESVAFANSDTVSHTVAFKTSTGFQCSGALPLAIAAGQTASCTFSTAGKYNFSDPAQKGNKFRGTVTVATSATTGALTLTPKVVFYGGKTNLAGTIASKLSGQSVQVLGAQCGTSVPKLVTTITTTTGGAFTYAAAPLMQTTYTVQVKNSNSPAATAKVEPRLNLRKTSSHHYSVRVFAAQTFAGKQAMFQRYRATLKRWVNVRRVVLGTNTTGTAPTVVSSAKFRSSIRAKQRIRVVLAQSQVGTCYVASRSNVIRS